MDMSALFQFFGGNFHQDWDLDYANEREVVVAAVQGYPSRESLQCLADDLVALASSVDDDAALEAVLERDLGCCIRPSLGGVSARQWVRDLAAVIREYL